MSYSPNRPNKQITLQRQIDSWNLYNIQKWTQQHIATHLGISQAAVSKLLKKTDDEYIRRLHAGEFRCNWPF